MSNITEEEAKLYDRQIRLWGLDAQKRLRCAKIMLIGVGGLGAEILKNITLAGVDHIRLVDSENVTENDLKSQFLIRKENIGENRAKASILQLQRLNPMVKLTFEAVPETNLNVFNSDWLAKNIDQSYSVVCATQCCTKTAAAINSWCRKMGVSFFYTSTFGFFGHSFMDLGPLHEFVQDIVVTKRQHGGEPVLKKAKVEDSTSKTVKKEMSFIPMQEVLDFDWSKNEAIRKKTPLVYFLISVLHHFQTTEGRSPSYEYLEMDLKKLLSIKTQLLSGLKLPNEYLMDDMFKKCFGDLSPVCAITGGIVAQEIIKTVSKKDAPLRNVFLFDGVENCGYVDCIGAF